MCVCYPTANPRVNAEFIIWERRNNVANNTVNLAFTDMHEIIIVVIAESVVNTVMPVKP